MFRVFIPFFLLVTINCKLILASYRDDSQLNKKILVYKDIAYDSLSLNQKIDVYLPEKESQIFPVIIWIHGGAFKNGDKAENNFVKEIKKFVNQGFAIVSMNYRLLDEATWPAQIYDSKAVVRWTRANAKKYNFNRNKIGVIGFSAGGNLSALLGTSGGISNLEGTVGEYKDTSSVVQAVVNMSGVMNYCEIYNDCLVANQPDCEEIIGKNLDLFGCMSLEDCFEKEYEASAESYISKNDPPFLTIQSSDELVPEKQGKRFHFQLLSLGVESKFFNQIGNEHANALFDTYYQEILDFFTTNLCN